MGSIYALRRWWAATRCQDCQGTGNVMLLPQATIEPCPACSVVGLRARRHSAGQRGLAGNVAAGSDFAAIPQPGSANGPSGMPSGQMVLSIR